MAGYTSCSFDFYAFSILKKMVVPLLLSTFTAVFLAELGDKTQLATVALSGTSNRPFAVFIGSSCALLLATFIGAIAGGSISSYIPSNVLKLVAAIGLLVIGLRLLWPLIVQNLSMTKKSS